MRAATGALAMDAEATSVVALLDGEVTPPGITGLCAPGACLLG